MKDGTAKIFVLTWRENLVFVYNEVTTTDADGTERVILEFSEEKYMPEMVKQGWGLQHGKCIDNPDPTCQHLYFTDGSPTIHVIDPETWTHV